MGVRILLDEREGAVLYDSVTGWAFGPLFPGGEDEAQEFLDGLELDGERADAREFTRQELRQAHDRFLEHKRKEARSV